MANEREWVSIADLMSMLMMVFLFIAILFMLKVEDDKHKLEEQHNAMSAVAQVYDETRNGLYDTMHNAFADDLDRWNAEILADGTIRFRDLHGLFAVNSSTLSPRFQATLDEFFPRYIAALSSDQLRDEINEIRIEGHTSSDGSSDDTRKYIHNVALSQERALSVLRYVYQQSTLRPQRPWLRNVLRANGVSSAQPILTADGAEDAERSRRVEFHTITNTGDILHEVLRRSRGE